MVLESGETALLSPKEYRSHRRQVPRPGTGLCRLLRGLRGVWMSEQPCWPGKVERQCPSAGLGCHSPPAAQHDGLCWIGQPLVTNQSGRHIEHG